MKKYYGLLIFIGVLQALGCGVLTYFYHLAGIIAFGVLLITMGVALLWLNSIAKAQQTEMDSIFGDNRVAASKIVENIAIPTLLCDAKGRIVWSNSSFKELYTGRDITAILPSYKPDKPQTVIQTVYGSDSFEVTTLSVERRDNAKALFFQYWTSRTEAAHYQRLYTEQMPYVMRIYVDNYEELASDLQFHRSSVLAEVEKLVSEMTRQYNGIYCRYESGRFLCVFEAQSVVKLEEEKFPLMEKAFAIDTGTSAKVSLSVAVGIAPRIAQSEESGRLAMELALGRGGDQVVIRDGSDYRFIGGKYQQNTRQSRVKTRLFSKALRQLLENSGDVFIMGHRDEDMDSFGAMLGIVTCVQFINHRPFMVMHGSNPTIDNAFKKLKADQSMSHMVISEDQARTMMRPNSVLVIVDTQRPSIVSAPKLLELSPKIVLIDHHRRSADYIDNATLHYLESRASSACEMVTETIQYFDDNLKPTSFVASCLLAGITVDTKQFAFNVGSRTFDAAGYLRRNGADLLTVKLMFQNDFDTYVNCAKTVEGAKIRDSGIAISICEVKTENNKLIAARSADELLGIRGVIAAFVLGEDGDNVFISGRSYGKVNVQLISEKLGGGGHLTVAGAQLKSMSVEQAKEVLTESIAAYEAENMTTSKGE